MNNKYSFFYFRADIFKILLPIILLYWSAIIYAQNDTIQYDVSVYGLTSSGKYSPFWLQNDKYGKISSSPSSTDLLVGIHKEYGLHSKLFDYGFKANLLIQADNSNSNVYFHELYAKARLSVFDLIIGSREEILGNQDSTLSGGGFLFSKNARPMPKITLGIEHFTPVPFTFEFLEIKGALTHGWFTDNIYTQGMLLHHKYLYGKIGGKLPVHFQYGIDHVVEWGGNVPNYGQEPSGFKDYLTIFLGHSGGSGGELINKLGNHIVSQSMRLDIDYSDFKIGAYWQCIAEDTPIRFIGNSPNAPDGLWGISIKNKSFPFVKGILYEYLNTTDQSGPYHDKDGIIYGGSDDYFSNYVYNNGWSYFSRIIGTPFITSALYNSHGEVYTLNNRVQVHHVGIEGEINGFNYKYMTSFSKNYGLYNDPINIKNISAVLNINKTFPKLSNLEIGCSIGADFGKLFGNSVGMLVTFRKRGSLFQY